MAAFDDLAFDDDAFDALVPEVPIPTPGVEVPDHVLEAIKRLPQQFRKPRIENVLRAFVGPSQPIESALWQLLTQRFITTAIGVQLDFIGTIVGQPRLGLDDDSYRRYIRARVAAHKSRGTTEELIKVASLVLLDIEVQIRVETQGPASVQVTLVSNTIPDGVAAIVVSFLRQSVDAGVKLVLVTQPGPESQLFTTAHTMFATLGVSPGFTLLTLEYVDADGQDPLVLFPSSGALVLDEGTAAEETVTYNARTANPFNPAQVSFALAAGVANTHAVGYPASLTDGPGAGWGNSSETGHPVLANYTDVGSTGGRMIDARE